MDAFAELGAALEEGWRDLDHDEERFPDLAAGLLERSAVFRSFDREAFFDHVLDPSKPGVQHLAPAEAFGQPGFTAFHGQGFVIEVYYWRNSQPAIHNHPFCGVFTVLEGWSVHATYKTSVPARAGDRGQVLDIRLSGLELVEPGHIERFSMRRHPLIHALVHVPVPSISLVVRTTRTHGYLRYLPPSVAIPMEPVSDPLARRIAMMESMVAADDPSSAARLGPFVENSDFVGTVQLLCALWPNVQGSARGTLLEWTEALHGDRVDSILAAANRSLRSHEASAARMSLHDTDLRLCATALAYAESRTQVLRLLEQRPGEPLERLRALAAVVYTDPEDPIRAVVEALIDGRSAAEAAAVLGAEVAEDDRDEIDRFCRESMFSVLAVEP